MAKTSTRKVSQSSKRIRLALIGAGGMANGVHYPSLAERPDVEMAAICDIDAKKLQATADKFSIPKRYSDYRLMLDEIKPDAVYCLMPPHHLFDISAEVLKRKLNLFVEKPLGLNSFQAGRLADLAKANGCLTMVGYNRRFAPLIVEAKKTLEKTGGVQLCRAVFHKHASPVYYDGATDALACDAIHVVDLMRFMGGEVKSLESAVTQFPMETAGGPANSWIAVLRFENGAVGELSAHWAAGGRRLYCEMHNPKVSVLCEPEVEAIFLEHGVAEKRRLLAKEFAGSEENRVYGGYKQENHHFMDCLKANKPTQSDFASAARSAELVERIRLGSL